MRPKRRLGQNFLTGAGYSERIVEAVAPRPDEPILEIGPGQGALTALLLEQQAVVTAIELDHELIPLLESRFGSNVRFRLIEDDALKVDFCHLFAAGQRVRVVANLPYYISTPLVQRLIAHRRCISEMTLMLQREVVERMIAPPGGKDYGYLSVLVQFYGEAVKLFDVPPGAFRPVPKVTSSIVRFRLRPDPVVPVEDEEKFFILAQVLFSQRRKTIMNNLRSGLARLGLTTDTDLPAILARAGAPGTAGIDGRRRAETLDLREMAALSDAIGREVRS